MVHIPSDAYVMIIGAMKCGTTSLYNYLINCPEICACKTKEPEFFTENRIIHQRNPCTVRRYEDLWDFDPKRHQFALEASTGYTMYPYETNVPYKIQRYGLRPKFIYLVRNPFARIRSQHEHISRRSAKFDSSSSLTRDRYLDISSYFTQLEQYRPYFPRESFLIVDFDELKSRPQACVDRVCRFLGLSNVPVSDSFPAYYRSPSRPEAFVGRHPLLQAACRFVPRTGRRLGKRLLERAFKKRDFTEEERVAVLNRLKDDMFSFQEQYGFNVAKWGWVHSNRKSTSRRIA